MFWVFAFSPCDFAYKVGYKGITAEADFFGMLARTVFILTITDILQTI